MGEGIMSVSPRLAIGRRGMVSGLAAGAALAPAALLPNPAWAGIPANRKLAFDVLRNGKPIGTHVLTFEQAGDALTVRVAVDLAVRMLGIVVYRYQTRATESWRGGVLMAAQAETNDDYGRYAMAAQRTNGSMVVEGTAGPTYTAPANSLVSSHWNPAQLQAPMISLQDGKLLEFAIASKGRSTIAARGTQLEADHFALSGPHALDLWYDRNRIWSKLKAVSWEGSDIEYRQV
jgi:hypothetical protein